MTATPNTARDGRYPSDTPRLPKKGTGQMNPYAMEQIARQRTADVQAQPARNRPRARNRPANRRSQPVRNLTGWALIQIGLALVTSSARHQQNAAMSPELP
jgi:hypothetical protein